MTVFQLSFSLGRGALPLEEEALGEAGGLGVGEVDCVLLFLRGLTFSGVEGFDSSGESSFIWSFSLVVFV